MSHACPVCDGPSTTLGVLGYREHLRCRDCGFDFSRKAQPPAEEVPCAECGQDIPAEKVDAKNENQLCEDCDGFHNDQSPYGTGPEMELT